jgi:VTC domain
MHDVRFDIISLEQLNAKAAMLERLDNKYVVDRDIYTEFLQSASLSFDVLDLAGTQEFRYDTRYFDTPDLSCFHAHQKGRRKRYKVRVRNYCDTKQAYLEIKLKDKRGSTIKKRHRCSSLDVSELDEEQKCFIGFCYRELYGEALPMTFVPSLNMTYKRSTLVAKAGGERLTVDNSLTFWREKSTISIPENRYVIETKSRNGNGIADQILRALHQHPINKCSKYCVGLALTSPDLTSNNFKSTISKLANRT